MVTLSNWSTCGFVLLCFHSPPLVLLIIKGCGWCWLDICILLIGPMIVRILALTGTFAAVRSGNDSSTSSAAETASRLARRALSGGDYTQLEDTFKAVGVVAYVGILICYAAAVGLPLWLVLRSNPSSEAAYSSNSLGVPRHTPPSSRRGGRRRVPRGLAGAAWAQEAYDPALATRRRGLQMVGEGASAASSSSDEDGGARRRLREVEDGRRSAGGSDEEETGEAAFVLPRSRRRSASFGVSAEVEKLV